jgi:murein DD-endopeptidase MepM/ murein hydrolase activator NlpD
MRTRFFTRALLAPLAVLALTAFRAAPAGTAGPAHRASAVPETEKAIPVEALEVSFPLQREGDPAVSRSDPTPATRLAWPAPGAITSPFGGARHHPGIDIDGVTGDPVVAAGAGTVMLAGGAPAGYSGYGNVVMIDHGNGIATLYAHLSRVDVAMGQAVAQGQQVGAIGATGLAFGDHLHFEVREAGKPVDPMLWLPART